MPDLSHRVIRTKEEHMDCDSVCHVPDTDPFDDAIAACWPPCMAGWGNFDRDIHAQRSSGGSGRVRSGAARRGGWPSSMDSGTAGTTRNWKALSGRAWGPQFAYADATVTAGRCDDRSGRGAVLQGVGGGCGRTPGRSASSELYSDETAGPANRGNRRALLADTTERQRQPQRGAPSLADHNPAFGGQSRRCSRSRQSALAGGVVPFARQPTRCMGGAT